jgi:hypothetical protein
MFDLANLKKMISNFPQLVSKNEQNHCVTIYQYKIPFLSKRNYNYIYLVMKVNGFENC